MLVGVAARLLDLGLVIKSGFLGFNGIDQIMQTDQIQLKSLSLLSVAITVNQLLESHKQSYQKRTKEEGRKQENEFIKTIDSICGHALGDEGNDSSIFINRSISCFMVMEPLDYTSIIWFQFPEKECDAFPKASGNAAKLGVVVLEKFNLDPNKYCLIDEILTIVRRKDINYRELQSGGYIYIYILYYYFCPIAWTVYGTQKVPAILLDPSIKWYVQNHLGYDLNFKAPTDVILVASAAFSALMFAVCIKILNFQHR
ncbi:hypothetical protein EZV62_003799 [Acer yangbiense]|uniref:Uncharacterized protein n=1 Tax=Acer yangbiense TaxID=1000413 RepID=A0A5C7IIW6_9ROSI|nr:hypothetical protein EZV62_003799 [Acer yangbiense]